MANIIFNILSILSIIFTIVMLVVMLIVFRKERRVNHLSPLLSIALSLILLPIFVLLSGARLNFLLSIPILLLGLGIGSIQGITTKLYFKDGQVVGKYSLFFLLAWCGTLVLSQLLNLLGSIIASSLGLIPLIFCTGTQIGSSGVIFLRRLIMRTPKTIHSC